MRLLLGIFLFGAVACAQPSESGPETVHSLFQVKEGKEADFMQVYAKAWAAYRRLGFVNPQHHVFLRAKDDAGKPYFVDVLTWKSHDIPDHMPPEIRQIWNQMEALCEPRNGKRGISFDEMQIVEDPR